MFFEIGEHSECVGFIHQEPLIVEDDEMVEPDGGPCHWAEGLIDIQLTFDSECAVEKAGGKFYFDMGKAHSDWRHRPGGHFVGHGRVVQKEIVAQWVVHQGYESLVVGGGSFVKCLKPCDGSIEPELLGPLGVPYEVERIENSNWVFDVAVVRQRCFRQLGAEQVVVAVGAYHHKPLCAGGNSIAVCTARRFVRQCICRCVVRLELFERPFFAIGPLYWLLLHFACCPNMQQLH